MLCDYVNIFQGNAEIDLPKPHGLAAKWFFIKAGVGNTSPAALIPFGAMSVAPYSGGYPTGYGNYLPNSYSRPKRFEEGKKILGFAHLQQSGTGAIGYYYNFALVTPKYPSSAKRREPIDEMGKPGYYSCRLDDILCELTSSKYVAYHRYSFEKDGGEVTIDFANNGLNYTGIVKEGVKNLKINLKDNILTASAEIDGVNVYFAVSFSGKCVISGNEARITNFGKTAELRLAISLRNIDTAIKRLDEGLTFDEAASSAKRIWEDALAHIIIETEDEQIKEIFYSNLYHSLVKPCDWHGESFVYSDGDAAFVTDLATLWDMYKTHLPLLMLSYPDIAKKTVDTLLNLCDAMGEIPNSVGITNRFTEHSTQARTLGDYVLMTAYRYGIKIDPHRMVRAIEKDIFADNKKDFTVDGRCMSHTFLLDMADCCALCAEIANEIGEFEIAQRLLPHAEKWKTAYDEKTGLLKSDCEYYEGTLYNYSFRQMVNMDERIKICSSKENFVNLLDDFFGYGKDDTVQPIDPDDKAYVDEGMKLCRFEGFNNESDTEAPFSYIYAGRHDKTCEVLRDGMRYMFTTGKGGIPGNNDSGALSSYYCFAALGIYPVAGQNLFLVGSPFIDKAEIMLNNGKTLKIEVLNNNSENIYVDTVFLNGKPITDFKIKADDLLEGGILKFTMRR